MSILPFPTPSHDNDQAMTYYVADELPVAFATVKTADDLLWIEVWPDRDPAAAARVQVDRIPNEGHALVPIRALDVTLAEARDLYGALGEVLAKAATA